MRTCRFAQPSFFVLFLALISVSAYAQGPLQFVSATPCRVVDTRSPNGPFGGPSIQGGMFRSFTLPGSPSCNIPSSAVAYSLNVTVVPQGPLGFLTVWPTGQTQPVVSTTNSLDGLTKANAAIVPAGTSGAVSVFASNTTDVVLDIDGYFVPATDSALAFYALTPCRVADTRSGQPLMGGVPQNFSVQGVCGVPATAEAYSLNFTGVPNNNPLGYLTVWPAGQTQPVVSTLNAPTGITTANAAIVPAGTSGAISAFASNTTDLVIDINGYFAPPGAAGELSLYTLPPCRVLDTRGTTGQFTGELTVDVVGSACNVPAGAGAYVLNATVVPQGALGYLTLWPDGGTQPVVSTLNAPDGQVTSNMAIVPTDNGKIDAYASNPTQLVIDIFSYLAPIVRITTASLPNGEVGRPYPQTQLMATGGVPPYTWTVTSGSGTFPPGLSLSTSGEISGTPTSAGTFNFTVQVKDTHNNETSALLSITIEAPLIITTSSLPAGQVNLPYDATLAATGGAPPYTWSIPSGSLPGGLTLNTGTGEISGTPSGAGTSNFTVQVEDSQMQTTQASLSITITAVGNATLNGTYAFAFSGYKSGGAVIMAGSFVADGAGHITGGVVDYNDGSGEFNDPSQCAGNLNCPIPLTIVAAPSSVYSLGANGLGTITIVATDHNGNQNTLQFAVAIVANACVVNAHHPTCGRLIQSDPSHPQDYGSGVLKVQDPNSFSGFFPVSLTLQITGTDTAGKRYAGAAALETNHTTLVDIGCNDWAPSGCPVDVNDNGSPKADPITGGQFSASLDSTTGRGSFVNLKFPDDPSLCTGGIGDCGYAYYVVNQEELIMISSDPISRPANLTLWDGMRQQSTSGWSLSSLNGTSVMELNALAPNNGSPLADVTAGLLAANGSGSATLHSDENQGGTLNLQQSSSGSYALDSYGQNSGRVTTSGFSAQFGSTPPVLYLIGNNYAFVVGTDAKASSGVLEPQSGAPFSNASVSGVYAGGSIAPVLTAVTNSVTSMFADAGGNIAATQDTSGPNGPGGPTNLPLTYSVDQTGRAVVNQNGNQYGILYVVSSSKVVLMPVGNSPALSVFASAPTN